MSGKKSKTIGTSYDMVIVDEVIEEFAPITYSTVMAYGEWCSACGGGVHIEIGKKCETCGGTYPASEEQTVSEVHIGKVPQPDVHVAYDREAAKALMRNSSDILCTVTLYKTLDQFRVSHETTKPNWEVDLAVLKERLRHAIDKITEIQARGGI